jgi:hypothetical protein
LWNGRALQADERAAAATVEQGTTAPRCEWLSEGKRNVLDLIAELASRIGSETATRVDDQIAGGESAFAYNSIELILEFVRPELDGH